MCYWRCQLNVYISDNKSKTPASGGIGTMLTQVKTLFHFLCICTFVFLYFNTSFILFTFYFYAGIVTMFKKVNINPWYTWCQLLYRAYYRNYMNHNFLVCFTLYVFIHKEIVIESKWTTFNQQASASQVVICLVTPNNKKQDFFSFCTKIHIFLT